jgi:hypothetical protein
MKPKMLLLLAIIFFWGVALSDSAFPAEDAGHKHNHSEYRTFSFFSLVKPLGICALSSLLITFLIGLFRRKLGRRFLKVHMTFAFVTIIIALFHGILVLVLF